MQRSLVNAELKKGKTLSDKRTNFHFVQSAFINPNFTQERTSKYCCLRDIPKTYFMRDIQNLLL